MVGSLSMIRCLAMAITAPCRWLCARYQKKFCQTCPLDDHTKIHWFDRENDFSGVVVVKRCKDQDFRMKMKMKLKQLH
jgi:predicted Fe-S protein YdhL (DUF1289 family)